MSKETTSVTTNSGTVYDFDFSTKPGAVSKNYGSWLILAGVPRLTVGREMVIAIQPPMGGRVYLLRTSPVVTIVGHNPRLDELDLLTVE